MSQRHIDQLDALGLAHDDILALVEGTLSVERAGAVRESLRRDGSLVAWVGALERDRESLLAIAREPTPAPSTVFEAVESALERDTLLGLSETPAAGWVERPAVSAVEPRKDQPAVIGRIFDAVFGSTRGLMLASAAGVALLLVGGVWIVANSISLSGSVPEYAEGSGQSPGNNGAIAGNDDARDDVTPVGEDPLEDLTIAQYEGAEDVLPDQADERTPEPTVAELYQLARQGRLAVTIAHASSDQTTRTVSALDKRAERVWVGGMRWSSVDRGTAYASLFTPMDRGTFAPTGTPNPRGPITIAGDGSDDEHAVDPAAVAEPRVGPRLPAISWRVAGVYFATCTDSPASFEDALDRLARVAPGVELVFRELDEPVRAPSATDAQSILWWTGSPQRWEPKLDIPVTIESAE